MASTMLIAMLLPLSSPRRAGTLELVMPAAQLARVNQPGDVMLC